MNKDDNKWNRNMSFGHALDIIQDQDSAVSSMRRECWDGGDKDTCILFAKIALAGNVIDVLILCIGGNPCDIWTPQSCDLSARDWSVSPWPANKGSECTGDAARKESKKHVN